MEGREVSEQYIYSATEELGGFVIIGIGLACIILLFVAQGLWNLYGFFRDRGAGTSRIMELVRWKVVAPVLCQIFFLYAYKRQELKTNAVIQYNRSLRL
jgi:hypothetical protein